MYAGKRSGCRIARPCAVDSCGRKPFPRPCPDPPLTCRPDHCGWKIPPDCTPGCPPPFGPPGCRPGPEICVSRPCDEDGLEECFTSCRELRIARLLEALGRMIGSR